MLGLEKVMRQLKLALPHPAHHRPFTQQETYEHIPRSSYILLQLACLFSGEFAKFTQRVGVDKAVGGRSSGLRRVPYNRELCSLYSDKRQRELELKVVGIVIAFVVACDGNNQGEIISSIFLCRSYLNLVPKG